MRRAHDPHIGLLARSALLEEIDALLRDGRNVLLFGPAGVGKTALINALPTRNIVILDPFELVSPHLAARIRRAIDRGVVHLAATRSLDRKHLGAVRRIAFWFTTVRVAPLSARWMHQLIWRECLDLGVPGDVVTPRWISTTVRLARGRAGLGLEMVRAAARIRVAKGSLPSPAVAYIEASIQRAGFSFDPEREDGLRDATPSRDAVGCQVRP